MAVTEHSRRYVSVIKSWVDSSAGTAACADGAQDGIDWLRILPFIGMHLACGAVFWVGWSPFALGVAVVLYVVRLLAITGFYHRYFSHRSFRTTRLVQFVFALFGAAAVQRGPLWWASHHRQHHTHSDKEADPHSPHRHGFLWSHTGWFLSRGHFSARRHLVRDWAKYPELRFLDRFDSLVPVVLAVLLFVVGDVLAGSAPSLGVDGIQLLIWGFFVSTVALFHATFTINSLAHRFGGRRYATPDDSRNNWWLALLTFGEGWHNNHHHYPRSARQGFYWWEVDLTYYFLRVLEMLGVVWDLRPVPSAVRDGRGRAADRESIR